jgi:membrane dipeptidase
VSVQESAARRVEELHDRAIVINGLSGSMALPRSKGAQFELHRLMREGGVTATNLTVSVHDGFRQTCTSLVGLLQAIDRQAGEGVRVIRTTADIRAAKAAGESGIIVGFQNSDPFEGHLPYVDLFHRLGLRICQLTYQRRNLAGDGTGEPANAGLSLYGRELVAELNRLGILVDLSHTGTAGCLEIAELSTAPVAVTHSCLKSFNDVSRNTDEEVARAVARGGGVFGVNAIARLLSPTGRQEGATIAQYVDLFDYLVDLIGIDHVGIGLDVNEGLTPELFEARQKGFLSDFPELRMGGDFPFEHYYVFGLTSISKVRIITEELVRRDYSDDDVVKILGGNFLRLFEQVWGG